MSVYPLTSTVGVRAYSEGARDALGNPARSWAAPVEQSVYGWAPAGTSEPFETGRHEVTWDLDLLVPSEFTCGPHDRIDVDGVTFEIEGHLQDYTHGPFGFAPGGVVRLKRVEG